MSDDWGYYDDQYDEDDLPVESGLMMLANEGVRHINGPVLGVVLQVNAADSGDHLFVQSRRGDGDTSAASPYLEADVLVLFNGVEDNMVLRHCVILQGKTSRLGPSEDEPNDFTEDVPNGCTKTELGAIRNGQEVPIEDLSGDWVLVDFIGGLLQLPVVLTYFPNPYNQVDAAREEDGRRFTLRRNGSGIVIRGNGDLEITHRSGQFLQFRGKEVTMKSIGGQMIHLDEGGDVNVVDGRGNVILMEEDGVTINTGDCAIALLDGDVTIQAPEKSVSIIAKELDVMAERIGMAGGGGGKSLVTEAFLPVMEQFVAAVDTLQEAIFAFAEAQSLIAAASTGTVQKLLPGYKALSAIAKANDVAVEAVRTILNDDKAAATLRTIVFEAD